MLLSFQPTAIGYACPYVWSGPGHSHPAVKLRKAGGTNRSASNEGSSPPQSGGHLLCEWSLFGFVVVPVSVLCDPCVHLWTGYAYCASVTPRHLRPAVRSERMRNSSLSWKWMCVSLLGVVLVETWVCFE